MTTYTFYSYKTNFTMRVTVLGSCGSGAGKLVAVDNMVIKMVTNTSSNANHPIEPEAEVKEKVLLAVYIISVHPCREHGTLSLSCLA